MTLQEIKAAIENGKKVYWSNTGYEISKDEHDQYFIKHSCGHCIGLTWMDGVTLNGKEEDFFVEGEKWFYTMGNVGRAKYTVNKHNGVKLHQDGSKFFDCVPFSNKKNQNAYMKELLKEGYKEVNSF